MRLSRRILATLGISAAMILGLMAAPAQASAYAYSACANPSGLEPDNCLQWTGGYPGGYIRAWAPSTWYYEIRLDTCSDANRLCDPSAWRTVRNKVLNKKAGYTLSYSTTKYGWYRLCARTTSVGKFGCTGVTGDYTIAWPLYLGD